MRDLLPIPPRLAGAVLLAGAAVLALLVAAPALAGAPAPVKPETPRGPPSERGPERAKPQPEARAEVLKRLYGDLAKAPDLATAEPIVTAIEQLWVQSDSPTASLLLNRALVAADAKNFDLAMQLLDSVTQLYPEWTEGFNRRAYLYVIRLDYTRALGDLRRVLALDPGNFRALEGLVQVLRTMGQDKAALEVVRELLKAHPSSPGAAETQKELERAVDGQGI